MPNYLARKCFQFNVFWAGEWVKLREKYGLPVMDVENVSEWKKCIEESIRLIGDAKHREYEQKALCSQNHLQYVALRLQGAAVPLMHSRCFQHCKWLIKIRGDLLNLKYRPYASDDQTCTLCSSREIEDAFHFIARCSALSAVRRRYLGRTEVGWEDYIEILRMGCPYLVKYCKVAWTLRQKFIDEYGP